MHFITVDYLERYLHKDLVPITTGCNANSKRRAV